MLDVKKISLVLAVAGLAMVGCDNKNSDPESAPVREQQTNPGLTLAEDAGGDLQASGTTMNVNGVVALDVDQEGTFEDYPTINTNLATLSSITEVRETDAHTYDLYAGDQLIMILAVDENNEVTIQNATNGFAAEDIRFNATNTGAQDLATGAFEFDLMECRTIEVPQEQGQEQEQGKAEVVAQDKGEAQVQAQDKAEVKEVKEEAQDCALATARLSVQEIEQPKEVVQEKDVAQDKEEVVVVAQDKEQAQQQGQDVAQPEPKD